MGHPTSVRFTPQFIQYLNSLPPDEAFAEEERAVYDSWNQFPRPRRPAHVYREHEWAYRLDHPGEIYREQLRSRKPHYQPRKVRYFR